MKFVIHERWFWKICQIASNVPRKLKWWFQLNFIIIVNLKNFKDGPQMSLLIISEF